MLSCADAACAASGARSRFLETFERRNASAGLVDVIAGSIGKTEAR
jgi:hypothetical protein